MPYKEIFRLLFEIKNLFYVESPFQILLTNLYSNLKDFSMLKFPKCEANSSHHNICEDCSKDFSTWTGLKEHWVQSPRHPYCQPCDEHFDDFSELEDHYDDSHYYCSRCERFFNNEYGQQEHYRQSSFHHYCSPCKRDFRSESNLKSVISL